MAANSVAYRHDNGLAIITLANSRGGNRLNPETLAALAAAFDAIEADTALRAVLINSDGPAFCLGMDLARAGEGGGHAEAVRAYSELLQRIVHFRLPVVAAVHGPVKAGGIGLAAACDIVAASEEADFQLSEVLLGLVPVNVLPFLTPARIPLARARELILTARTISAAEAHAAGLVDRIVPAGRLEREVKSIIKMLFRAEPGALALAKQHTAAMAGCDAAGRALEAQCRSAQAALLELIQSDAVGEALKAFALEELPEWSVGFKTSETLVHE